MIKRQAFLLALLLGGFSTSSAVAKPCPTPFLTELGYSHCNIEQHPISGISHDEAFLPDGRIIYKKWLGLDAPGTAVQLYLLTPEGKTTAPFQFNREDFCLHFSNQEGCRFSGADIGGGTQVATTANGWLLVSNNGKQTFAFSMQDGGKPKKIGKVKLPADAWPDTLIPLENENYIIFAEYANIKKKRMQVASTQINEDGEITQKLQDKGLKLGQFRSSTSLPNGELIIAGLDHRSGGAQSGIIQKINANGTADWVQSFEKSDYHSEFKIKAREDGLSVLMGLAEEAKGSFSDDKYLPFLAATTASGSVHSEVILDTPYYGAALDGDWEKQDRFLFAAGSEYGSVHGFYRLDEKLQIIESSDFSKTPDFGSLLDMRRLETGDMRLVYADSLQKTFSVITLKNNTQSK